MATELKDRLGTSINEGDVIAYATTQGRSGALKFAIVSKVNKKVTDRPWYNPESRKYEGTKSYTSFTLRVDPISYHLSKESPSFNYYIDEATNKYVRSETASPQRARTLHRMDNILVLKDANPNTLSESTGE